MLEWLPSYGNKKTTQYYNHIKENMSEINDIVELTEGILPINNSPKSIERP